MSEVLKFSSQLHSSFLSPFWYTSSWYIMSNHHKRNSYQRSHSKSYTLHTNLWLKGDKKLQNQRASPNKGEETTQRLDRITMTILYHLWKLIGKFKKVAHYRDLSSSLSSCLLRLL